MGQKTYGKCMWATMLFTNHATLYLAPRTPCQKYPLLQLVTGYHTPTNPPPAPRCWAPPRAPPKCRRRLVSDSDSTETEQSSPTPPKNNIKSGWTLVPTDSTVTLSAQNAQGTTVTVTIHL
ncbi:E4 protein [human papillomavirus 102]|uniref:E4 n=1 Tax=human papillomavirus 102 TaxID=338327 RepID=Q2VJB6_9PAPI|nr:E4 protein [human papillomavirus 102]ALT55110.1 E4 [human papillomavirus 102]